MKQKDEVQETDIEKKRQDKKTEKEKRWDRDYNGAKHYKDSDAQADALGCWSKV